MSDGTVVGKDVIFNLPEIFEGKKNVYLVCDINTYNSAGKTASVVLEKSGMLYDTCIIDSFFPLPDEKTVGTIIALSRKSMPNDGQEGHFDKPDLVVGVGSGAVNEAAKLCSFCLGVDYAVVVTALTNEDFFSPYATVVLKDAKKTYRVNAPKKVVVDIGIVSQAPYELLLSGMLDCLSKYALVADIEIEGGYYGRKDGMKACEMLRANVVEALESFDKIRLDREEFVLKLAECYKVFCDLENNDEMLYLGIEHEIAKHLEEYDLAEGTNPKSHGIYSCQACVLVGGMLKLLYEETDDQTIKDILSGHIENINAVEAFYYSQSLPFGAEEFYKLKGALEKCAESRKDMGIIKYLFDIDMFDSYAERSAIVMAKKILEKLENE